MPMARPSRAGSALALLQAIRRAAFQSLVLPGAALIAMSCSNEPTEAPADAAIRPPTALSIIGCDGCRRDNFTAPDGTLLENHLSDGGGTPFAWVKTFGGGAYPDPAVIQNNAVGKTSSGFWRYITNALEADSIEIEVEVLGNIASVSQQYDMGIVLRNPDPGSGGFGGYTIFWSAYGDGMGTADAFITVDRPGGTLLYEENVPIPTPGAHTLGAAVLETGVINVYVDRVLAATVVDPSPLPPGNAGLNFGWTGAPPGIVWITTFAEGLGSPATPLNVACSPVLVTRGATVTCTASAADPSAQFTVDEWRFDGAGLSASIIEAASANIWSGIAATSGAVRVKGKLDGAPAEGQTALNVVARDWSQDTVAYQLTDVTPNNLTFHPARPGDLGNHQPLAEAYLPAEGFPQISSGPNQGVFYFTKVPVQAVSEIRINRVALAPNSDFYFLQPESVPPYSTKCTRNDVFPFLPKAEEHEGFTLAPASHAGTFRRELNLRVPQATEDVVALNDVSLLQLKADAAARPGIHAADSSSNDLINGGSVPPIVYHCDFTYF